MASKYRKIDPRIWDDEVFDNLDARDAFTVLWLTTCRGLNRAGVCVVSLGEAADKLRLNGADEAWDTLSTVCPAFKWPMQKVGRSTVVIILRTWFRYNAPSNNDHLKGMLSDLSDLPSCDLLSQYSETVKPYLDEVYHELFDTLSTPCRHPADTQSTPGRHQKQKQKRELKQKREQNKTASALSGSEEPHVASNGYSKDFEKFWQAFPKLRRTAKGKAWNAWRVAIGRTAPARLINRAAVYASSDKGRGEFAQMPSSWLTGRCWDDDDAAWQGNGQTESHAEMLKRANRPIKPIED